MILANKLLLTKGRLIPHRSHFGKRNKLPKTSPCHKNPPPKANAHSHPRLPHSQSNKTPIHLTTKAALVWPLLPMRPALAEGKTTQPAGPKVPPRDAQCTLKPSTPCPFPQPPKPTGTSLDPTKAVTVTRPHDGLRHPSHTPWARSREHRTRGHDSPWAAAAAAAAHCAENDLLPLVATLSSRQLLSSSSGCSSAQ